MLPVQGLHIVIPRHYEHSILHRKVDFADIFKDWRWGDYSGLSQRPYKREAGESELDSRIPEAESERICCTVGFWHDGRACELRNAGSLQKQEPSRKTRLP